MNYIDLFSGIGGFHQAVSSFSTKHDIEMNCVFAADFDKEAANIYKLNYLIDAHYDLTLDSTHELISQRLEGIELDLVLAGFPCQPFSKAGSRKGFDDETKGTLFFEIEKIVRTHKPKYILLENVRNLKNHDNGNTWVTIESHLKEMGYFVDHVIAGPNRIGSIPALRDRIFIMCYRIDLKIQDKLMFNGAVLDAHETSIVKKTKLNKKYFSKSNSQNPKLSLSEVQIEVIDMWDDLIKRLKAINILPPKPFWLFCLKDSYDNELNPEWKKKIVNRNRIFYAENFTIVNQWLEDYTDTLSKVTDSMKKLEWNVGDNIDTIWRGIIQFRPSGVRVKTEDTMPTFVAINHIPIIGVEKRYISPGEMAKLYGFKKLKFGNQGYSTSYKQLGNTVSVDVVRFILEHMNECSNFNFKTGVRK